MVALQRQSEQTDWLESTVDPRSSAINCLEGIRVVTEIIIVLQGFVESDCQKIISFKLFLCFAPTHDHDCHRHCDCQHQHHHSLNPKHLVILIIIVILNPLMVIIMISLPDQGKTLIIIIIIVVIMGRGYSRR